MPSRCVSRAPGSRPCEPTSPRRWAPVREAGIADLLLLFMYLEIVSMVETYWRMGKLPVRMPLYIAMVGIGCHLMADSAFQSPLLMVSGAGAIVLLALGVLIVRCGHTRFPYDQSIGRERLTEPRGSHDD